MLDLCELLGIDILLHAYHPQCNGLVKSEDDISETSCTTWSQWDQFSGCITTLLMIESWYVPIDGIWGHVEVVSTTSKEFNGYRAGSFHVHRIQMQGGILTFLSS